MGVLREETVSGMNRIGIADFCRADDSIDFQIAFLTRRPTDAHRLVGQLNVKRVDVCLGIDGHCWNPQFFASSDDSQRDLTAVGNQDFVKHDYFTRKSG